MPLDEMRLMLEQWGNITGEPRGVDYTEVLASWTPASNGWSPPVGRKWISNLYGAFPVKRLFWVVLTVFCFQRERPFFVKPAGATYNRHSLPPPSRLLRHYRRKLAAV